MTEKFYGGNKWSYGVTECEDGWIEVRVYHDNQHVRKLLYRFKDNPRELLRRSWKGLRAAIWMGEVLKDFRSYFEDGRVRVIFPGAKTENTPGGDISKASTSNGVGAPPRRRRRSHQAGPLDAAAGREFFYRQFYRLRLTCAEELPEEPGLYGVFEDGQSLGQAIGGLAQEALRCVKVGMSEDSIRQRIQKQYYGGKQRAAVTRRHVGDALIGRAIELSEDFAGFPVNTLGDVRKIWNAGTSPSEAIQKQSGPAARFHLSHPSDLTRFEAPIEKAVTAYMQSFRFIGVTARAADIAQIEHAANSLLRDVAHVDPPSPGWLGRYSRRAAIRTYGLWAVKGVTRSYTPYASHSAELGGQDEQGRPVSDWLNRLRGLIDVQIRTT